MTAPDPRLDEIQARLEPALFHAPYIVDGRRVIQANNHPAIAPYMLSDNSMPVIAEFIANAPTDVSYLVAELRKAHEALTRVEGLHQPRQFNPISDGVYFGQTEFDHNICAHDHERWPCPTMEALRAAVAAANGDGNG